MKITNYILPTSRTHGSFSTIKSWDTMNYIKHLIRHTNDPIFEEQFYKITQSHIDFDKRAKDEKNDTINIYDNFFYSSNDDLDSKIRSMLNNLYEKSLTFRRIINYYVKEINLSDYGFLKCKILPAYAYNYEMENDAPPKILIPIDHNLNFIDAKYNGETYRGNEEFAINLFLQHILHNDIQEQTSIDLYTSIINKELDSNRKSYNNEIFNNFSFDKSVKLNSYNYIADDIEQVIDKGSKVQLEVYNLLSEEKIFEHKIMNNWTRSIKNILTTYLFMSSGAVTARNVQTFSPTINNESRIRLPRALPVGHPYPEEHKASGFSPFMMGGLSGDILPEILTGNGPSIFFNGKHNNQHDEAFGKIIDFTQNGNKISAKDKEIIKRYIFDKINVLIKEYFIRTGKNSHTPFEVFIKERLFNQYDIFKTLARDILAHPLVIYDAGYKNYHESLNAAIAINSRPLQEIHYGDVLYHYHKNDISLGVDTLYGRESFDIVLDAMNVYRKSKKMRVISNNEMKKSIKISELVIHNIIKKGLTNCLLKKDVLNARYDLIRDILRYSLNIRQGIKHDDVNRIAENIIKKYGITEGMNPKPRNARISKELLLLAVDRQIEWAKKHFITKDVLENVVSKCDLSSIFNVNKVLQNTILEFVHEINNISSARWMSKSEKNNKQKEAIEKFKKEVSHMNGGQQFIWGFDKVIQEGLSGLIELSIDINDSTNHRDKSSLSPDGRAVLHFLGTIWNMAMGAVPGYNALSGVSSILHSAIVKESSNICDYIQGAVRIGMDFVPGTRSDLHSRSLQIKYEALKHIEKNINDNIIYHPSNNANFYSVIESIDGNDFIYNEKQSKILEMKQDRGGNRYSAVDLNSSKYGYYEKVGGGFYRYIESFNPISSETPNKIVYKGESVDLTKEPNSELYSGRYSINNKQVNVYFFRDADGTFYKSEGLHGGGVIRYIDKPYSQLREGDIGYDEDLLDIYDDSPVLEDTLPALSSEIVPTPEHSIKQIYSKIKEGHIELSDSDIILCRGTTGIQAENIVEYKTAGGLPDSNPNVKAPDEYMAQQQVRIGRILPEYTSDLSVADRFSREHYLIVVKVKAKYITRGSVTESGWVIDKTAPVEPLAIIDRTFGMKENISMVNASK